VYTSGPSVAGVTTAVGGAELARTGFPIVGFTMIAIALLVVGLALFRSAVVRRHRADAGISGR
jgi:hypothetical protein